MRVLSFGEILWDVFGDEKTIGGAPFNFAAHLSRLGAESYMVSCVGKDDDGASALEECKRLGIKTDYISVDRRYKTGRCEVTLNGNMPSYDLVRDTAYDHIPNTIPSGKFDALYMGTLALRSPDSRRAFNTLLKYADKTEVFFDVNFRGDFYTRELVSSLLRETTILKLSSEEISFFGKRDALGTCLDLASFYPKLKLICVTLGKDGALVYDTKKKTAYCSEKPSSKAVSTVGAGDSFAAAFLRFYLAGEPINDCLDKAVKLSDFVVTKLGAIPDYDPEELFK